MSTNLFVASSLGLDPHTEGMYQAAKIAELSGISSIILPPSDSLDLFCKTICNHKPQYIGLSYRLTPTTGIELFKKAIYTLYNEGVVDPNDDVKICFSGLPQTIQIANEIVTSLPLKVRLIKELSNPLDRAVDTLDFFGGGGNNRDKIIEHLKEELIPQRISLLDELADEIVRTDNYKSEPPLRIPSTAAQSHITLRMQESDIPLLRTHFGIPDKTIIPTVEGIRELAEARVVDEISLGSSDLSQRFFDKPDEFEKRKNDGGVPYRNADDLKQLFDATRYGNMPALKPYCHVNNIVPFIHTCIKCGLLRGAHQAIPLFWFNELDGRGPMTVRESLHEHFAAVSELARLGIPVEMNDPNQWSSRLAHDTIITTSYALICSVMKACGVKDMIFQMQLNKPKETGDYADLAKMGAAKELIASIKEPKQSAFIETRTGIESLSTDIDTARWQLARSTLLQMCLNPSVIHIVSYCEANYAARPKDIIDSSRLIRRAVKIFRAYQPDILNAIKSPIIEERKQHLINETISLLDVMVKSTTGLKKKLSLNELCNAVANPDLLANAIEKKIFTAPGVANKKYKGEYITKVMKYGMINAVDNYSNPLILTESERLKGWL